MYLLLTEMVRPIILQGVWGLWEGRPPLTPTSLLLLLGWVGPGGPRNEYTRVHTHRWWEAWVTQSVFSPHPTEDCQI